MKRYSAVKKITMLIAGIIVLQLFATPMHYNMFGEFSINNKACAKDNKAETKEYKHLSDVKIGDDITFGEKRWYKIGYETYVLSYNDGDRPWNYTNNEYKYSLIRWYLNHNFLNKISKEDQSLIEDSGWKCGKGNDEYSKEVIDKVGLLTYKCLSTLQETIMSESYLECANKYYWGWTMTPIGNGSEKEVSSLNRRRCGCFLYFGETVSKKLNVRPVIHLNSDLCISEDGSVFFENITILEEHSFVSDGTIKIFAYGGSNNYEYSIDRGLTWHDSYEFTGLKEDTYYVMARDKYDLNKVSDYRTVYLRKAKSFSTLKFGDAVFFAGRQWIVLNPSNGLLIMSENDGNRQWDKNSCEDYENSSIRKYLNEDFLNKIPEKERALIQDWTWNCGEKYKEEEKTVRDKIGLLSKSEFDKYNDFFSQNVTLFDWWLINSKGLNADVDICYYIGVTSQSGVRPAIHIRKDVFITDDREIVFDDRNLISQIDIADVYLYYKNEEDGLLKDMILKIGDKERVFNWTNVSGTAPKLIIADLNMDKTDELIVILAKANEVIDHSREIHVININTLEEIKVTNVLEVIHKMKINSFNGCFDIQ
ncbi:DUF6273 domain-containing protein [Abyssisolibacter fermentans]|uniref:DUF6273 domain-containing protein n=1 Tax=Abyssisolibacter fermentans TaxID=1766203 RepID=UPI00082A8B99|nr:DUF6273 domain-containing protein [Abyssisolibacter fermentans]